MRHLLRQIFGRMNWLLVGTIGLAIFQVSPLLHTGFLADDAANSLVRGILQYYDITIFQLVFRDVTSWLAQARLYPLASVHIYLVFYLLPSLPVYKGFVIGLILLNLLLFHQLVRRIVPLPGFPELALLSIITLFQFRIYHDPILGFGGLLQVVFVYMLASLLSLCRYFESAKLGWLLVSLALYLLGLLTYELTYPMFLLYMLFAYHYSRSWKRAFNVSAPFCGAVIVCVATCILLRTVLGRTAQPAYRPNSDLSAYLHTLSKQLFAAVPLSYPLTVGRPYLHPWPRLHHAWPFPIVFFGASSLVFLSLRTITQCAGCVKPLKCWCALPIAIALWILPALLVCLSPRYQHEIFWGVGQLPVYMEYYGVGLLLALTVAGCAAWLARWAILSRVGALTASLAVASALSLTGHINHNVAKKWSPGWYDERVLFESALHSGLAERVPDGATLLAPNRYPWWHDVFGAYFYCMNSGKRLRFPSSIQLGPAIPLIQGGTSGNEACLPCSDRCYEVYDYRIDSGFAYVFLCELAEPAAMVGGQSVNHKTGRGSLFVHGRPTKGEPSDDAFCITADGGGTLFSVHSDGCKLLGRGADWRVYSFETGDHPVDGRSLRVVR